MYACADALKILYESAIDRDALICGGSIQFWKNGEKLPAVFYIEFSNEKMADVICEDTGCGKLRFHSCHNVSAEDLANGATYLDLMWQNVETVKEALG